MPHARIIPCLVYRDAQAAIEWLCDAFGFEKHLVCPGEKEGSIAHAELTFNGRDMIMLGDEKDEGYGLLTQAPQAPKFLTSQSSHIIVDDADAHYARSKAAGAEIVMEVEDQHYGGRLYMCRDPQGHLWSFGTYDPWNPSA